MFTEGRATATWILTYSVKSAGYWVYDRLITMTPFKGLIRNGNVDAWLRHTNDPVEIETVTKFSKHDAKEAPRGKFLAYVGRV